VKQYSFRGNLLCARRKTNGQVVFARTELESNGPFICPDCNELVVLRRSPAKIPHFAHTPSGLCHFSAPESEAHLRCKIEIYQGLLKEPGVRNVQLERPLGTVRPDVSAETRVCRLP
jgi:competence protein CoiA